MSRQPSSSKRGSGTAHADHPTAHSTRRMTGAASRPARSKSKSTPTAAARAGRGKNQEAAHRALLAGLGGGTRERVEVDYTSGPVSVAITPADRDLPVLTGAWQGTLHLADGHTLPLTGDWESACWHSDSDGDYLELQLHPAEGLRIDRMLFLSRTGQFALLADAIVTFPGAPQVVQYSSTLPIEPSWTAASPTSSRERSLKTRGTTVRLFPLGLASDPAAGAGTFDMGGGHLTLVQPVVGGATWAPLLLDWNPARTRKPAVWRKLTVSESRVVLGPHQAAAARWQCGGEHLLCFRGLTAPELARAVLGMHTWYETVVARIPKPGIYTPLVQIEPAPST